MKISKITLGLAASGVLSSCADEARREEVKNIIVLGADTEFMRMLTTALNQRGGPAIVLVSVVDEKPPQPKPEPQSIVPVLASALERCFEYIPLKNSYDGPFYAHAPGMRKYGYQPQIRKRGSHKR